MNDYLNRRKKETRSLFWGIGWVLISLLSHPVARADVTVVEESTNQGVRLIYQMQVTPAAEPNPTMKYRLTVEPYKTIPGNAITHYLRSFGENSLDTPWNSARDKYGDTVYDWLGYRIPIKDLPLDDLREASQLFDTYVENHIARATLCRQADWGLNEEDLSGMEAISFLLPSVQQTRSISRALALQTRFAIAESRYEDAIRLMRMNYQLAQNVSKMKFLVASLVGIAEVGIANNNLIDLIGAPDSPNMYWALAELPRPIINLRESLRLEMSFGVRLIPELKDVETAEHSEAEWARILEKVMATLPLINEFTGGGSQFNPLVLRGIALASYPSAKRALINQGMDPVQVEAMPVGQVLLIDMAREYERLADLHEKTIYMPYRDAIKFVSAAEEELRMESGKLRFGKILASQLLPAISQVRTAVTRVERQRNALQVIEAIRMHLAETGKLPTSLDEIKTVPIPLNPFTGKSFLYSCDGETAKLDLPFGESPGYAVQFEIQVAK